MGNLQWLLDRLYGIPAIIVALILHEFMHAYIADKLGDPTPRMQGRLTLNPISHIDPVGFILIIIAGIGWAKPVQVNSSNFSSPKKANILVSIVGPLTNLCIAFLFYGFYYFSQNFKFMQDQLVISIYEPFIFINIMLFALNIIPVPPLDGFHVLENIIHYNNFRTLAAIKRYGIILIFILMLTGLLSSYISIMINAIMFIFSWVFSLIGKFAGLF